MDLMVPMTWPPWIEGSLWSSAATRRSGKRMTLPGPPSTVRGDRFLYSDRCPGALSA
jgi:hypothetical protein